MTRRMITQKIQIVLALVLLMAAAFSAGNSFTNTAFAPFMSDNRADIANNKSAISSKTADAPAANAQPIISEKPGASNVDESASEITVSSEDPSIHMDDSDIYHGSLILVNQDHRYEIPETEDFIAVSGVKTPSYKVADTEMVLSSSIIEPLNEMMDAFYAETGNDMVTIRSAFRSYELQQNTFNEYVLLVGRIEATRWASLPGYSEHHTGLAFDFGIDADGEVKSFTNVGANTWFVRNSWRYGFILRFPSDKTSITKTAYEPWHFRYVGKPHSYIIFINNWCFEEYIEVLMGYSRDEPYTATYEDSYYEIYYTQDTEIDIPPDREIDISGNNIDGYIVTMKY